MRTALLAALTLPLASTAAAQQAGTIITETYALPLPMQAAPVQAAPASPDGQYVDIGAYPGGELGTLDTVPLAPAAPVYDLYQPMPESAVPVYAADPAPTEIAYAPLSDIPAFAQAAGMGGSYEADRLAAFDADGDGTVTTREAIATLAPLGN